MRTPRGTERGRRPMDVMYVWEAFGERPASSGHDTRRWLRQALLVLAATAALLLLLGAVSGAWTRTTRAAGPPASATAAAARP